MVICLERGADLHMSQLMPLPLTVSCLSKIQIGFTFLVPAHPDSPGKSAIKRLCVCVCVCVWLQCIQTGISRVPMNCGLSGSELSNDVTSHSYASVARCRFHTSRNTVPTHQRTSTVPTVSAHRRAHTHTHTRTHARTCVHTHTTSSTDIIQLVVLAVVAPLRPL